MNNRFTKAVSGFFFARRDRVNEIYKEAESEVNPNWKFRDVDNRGEYKEKVMGITGFPYGQWDRDEMKAFWARQESGEKVNSMARSWIQKRRALAAQEHRRLMLEMNGVKP